jgi:hypothetical protein
MPSKGVIAAVSASFQANSRSYVSGLPTGELPGRCSRCSGHDLTLGPTRGSPAAHPWRFPASPHPRGHNSCTFACDRTIGATPADFAANSRSCVPGRHVTQPLAGVKSCRAEMQSRRAEMKSRRAEMKSRRAEMQSRRAEMKSRRAGVKSRRAEMKSCWAGVKSRWAEMQSRWARMKTAPASSRPLLTATRASSRPSRRDGITPANCHVMSAEG